MTDLIYRKILKRMENKPPIQPREFHKDLIWVRYSKQDCDEVIKEMRRKGLIRIVGSGRNRGIVINRRKVPKMIWM